MGNDYWSQWDRSDLRSWVNGEEITDILTPKCTCDNCWECTQYLIESYFMICHESFGSQ